MPLRLIVEFAPADQGVNVTLTIWTPDLVLRDTGEGQYLDMMLERLINADLAQEPPKVPNLSFAAQTAVVSGVFTLVSAPIPVLLPVGYGLAMAIGIFVSGFVSIGLAISAYMAMLRARGEVVGAKRATQGLAAGLAGTVICLALFIPIRGPQVKELAAQEKAQREQTGQQVIESGQALPNPFEPPAEP